MMGLCQMKVEHQKVHLHLLYQQLWHSLSNIWRNCACSMSGLDRGCNPPFWALCICKFIGPAMYLKDLSCWQLSTHACHLFTINCTAIGTASTLPTGEFFSIYSSECCPDWRHLQRFTNHRRAQHAECIQRKLLSQASKPFLLRSPLLKEDLAISQRGAEGKNNPSFSLV